MLDRLTAREVQQAVMQHLPFLPAEIVVNHDTIELHAHAAAPNGLIAPMAFFVNGYRFTDLVYPADDPGLRGRFPDLQGMGLAVHARMTNLPADLAAARFLRFDACPLGTYVGGHWRQAIHFMNPAFERYPMPPEGNIKRVIGDTSAVRFAMGGAMIFKNIEALISELGHSWSDFPQILDWGCGAGRVTRYLISETESAVCGADIDPDNVAWCKSHLTDGEFVTVPLRPPTAFADGRFDMIIGLSVLTHLSESDQWLWLGELRRITRPGALVLLSVSGPTQFAYTGFPLALYRRLQSQGFLDLARDPALDAVISEHEYYRAAFHSREYIVSRWSDYFEVVAIIDAIAAVQDFVVLRRRQE
jgi:SAM-dependent methyltransferase